MNNTIILFPDISGFTEFVSSTEIEHGQQIIASLLEEIIKSNYLGFIVSEIEGDSVLFYKVYKRIDVNDLLKLCLNIHGEFHKRRIEINNSTRCNCGACSSIKNLTIKFVIHFGDVSLIKIYKFSKLYGLDVIIAHRLLKNNINSKEYILITNKTGLEIESITDFNPEITGPSQFIQNFEKIGVIEGHYFTFKEVN